MNKNRTIYERATVLDDILEIAIPKMFNRAILQGDNKNEQSCVEWTNNNNESIYLYQLEPNQYSLRDIIQAARVQMVTEKQELKNLGAYIKSSIKENMVYILDSIRFDIKG